jgi:hypothetical protein
MDRPGSDLRLEQPFSQKYVHLWRGMARFGWLVVAVQIQWHIALMASIGQHPRQEIPYLPLTVEQSHGMDLFG